MKKINQPCEKAISHLIEEMELEDFGQKELIQIVQQFPDCEKKLMETHSLWSALNGLSVPTPRAEMSTNFYRKLNEYSNQSSLSSTSNSSFLNRLKNLNLGGLPQLNWAFTLGLVMLSFLAGQFYQPKSDLSDKIDLLTLQIQKLEAENSTTVNLEGSVASRLKNVHLVRQNSTSNATVLAALNTTLCMDPNVNVRLSAIESLVHFSDDPAAREILIKAIPKQKSSLVQLELAEVMIQLEEKGSATQWKELLESGDVELDVKMQLEETLQVFL